MPFTLVQLATLVQVAAQRSYTRAAAALYLTQPAVTQQIRALERQVGAPLVEVVGRQPELTDAGRFLASRARDLLDQVDALERDMRAFATAAIGELHIGATLTIGTYVLPHLLARLRAVRPHVATRIEIANTAAIAARVRTGAVSLALVEGDVSPDEFDCLAFQDDELILIAPLDHPLARSPAPRLADLAGVPLVMREAGSGTRDLVERTLWAAGVAPVVALELSSGEGVVRAVEAGIGLAMISRLVAADGLAAGRIVAIPALDLAARRVFQAVTPRGRARAPVVQTFLDLLRG